MPAPEDHDAHDERVAEELSEDEAAAVAEADQPDDLHRALAAADPAAALPPLPRADVERLVAATLTEPAEQLEESRRDGVRRRGRLTWSTAAAVIVVLVVAGGLLWRNHRDSVGDLDAGPEAGGPPQSGPATTGVPSTATTTAPPTELQLSGVAGRCAVPSADTLGTLPLAFAANVVARSDDSVTLEPTQVYVGSPGASVVVDLPASISPLDLPVDFEDGTSYLVAAGTDGQVAGCGLSGPDSASLEQLYADAFGG